MEELWKLVVGYENIYRISENGIVQVFERRVPMPSKWGYKNTPLKIYPSRILKHKITKDGHHRVKLCKEGIRKWWSVHRLVAFAFINGYFEGAIINHLDSNKSNNHYSNLEWTTHKGNIDHAFENNRMRNRNGQLQRKLFTEEDIRRIRKLHKEHKITANQVARKYGCHSGYAYLIFKNKRWKHVI